jgi:hypothetical protein
MGVQLDPDHASAPPRDQIPSILASIDQAVKDMPDDADIAVVGRATEETGWQGAVIVKAPHGWNVHAWIGDPDWSGPAPIDKGIEILKTWRF